MPNGTRRWRGVIGLSVLWTLLWIGVLGTLVGLTAVLDPKAIDDGEGSELLVVATLIGASAGLVLALLGAGLAALARRAARRPAGRRVPVTLMPLHDIIGP